MTSATDTGKRPAAKPAEEGEEFLQRWSRRKRAARQRAEEVVTPEPAAAKSAAPAKVLTDADMPPIETLDEKSDYSVFMSPGVSHALRSQALRRLFTTLPGLNQPEALNSEFYDMRGLEPLGNVITHEMRDEMEREAQKLRDAAVAAVLTEKKAKPLLQEGRTETGPAVRRHSPHLRKRSKQKRSRA